LKTDWQRHVIASRGYLELGMFDDAAMVLEEIGPEDNTRTDVLGARVVRVHPAAEFVAAFPNGAIEFGFLDGHG
jgi:hypothetical protein